VLFPTPPPIVTPNEQFPLGVDSIILQLPPPIVEMFELVQLNDPPPINE
jgi:hypothetical protein